MKRFFSITFGFLIIFLAIFFATNMPKRIKEKIYPLKYEEYVYKYAKENDVDPLLIMAIIKVESNFNETIVSKAGAIGLMQLMDTTASEVAKKLGIENYSKDMLYEPEINIRLGIKYFAELVKEFNKNELLAVIAYNAGGAKVKGWIKEGKITEDGKKLENIPYPETNSHIRKVIRDYEMYKKLYG